MTLEDIPGTNNGLGAAASAAAPFIYFDNVPNFGAIPGIIVVPLTAQRLLRGMKARPASDQAVVAHLRMNRNAARSRVNALEKASLAEAPAPGAKN